MRGLDENVSLNIRVEDWKQDFWNELEETNQECIFIWNTYNFWSAEKKNENLHLKQVFFSILFQTFNQKFEKS